MGWGGEGSVAVGGCRKVCGLLASGVADRAPGVAAGLVQVVGSTWPPAALRPSRGTAGDRDGAAGKTLARGEFAG